MGIPIAPFSIVEIQEVLINVAPPELRQVGHGLAFGSVQNDGMTLDLGRCTANLVDASDRRNIIAFDWWVRNEDRKLTEHGGNVNLLWNDNSRRVVVFDHNLAFDESFNTADFFAEHVFRTDWYDVAGDFFYREEYQKRFAHALSFFEGACDAMPIDWRPDFDGQPVSPSERLIFDKLRLYDAYGYWDTKK